MKTRRGRGFDGNENDWGAPEKGTEDQKILEEKKVAKGKEKDRWGRKDKI